MRSFEGESFGSPDVYRLIERAVPEPAPDQVRIAIRATALGFVDGLMVQGRYQIKPPLPYVPGGEIAGVVDAVGSEVRHLGKGDRVQVRGTFFTSPENSIRSSLTIVRGSG